MKKIKWDLMTNKYGLLKKNGCFDINKALMLEQLLKQNIKQNIAELKTLQEMLK